MNLLKSTKKNKRDGIDTVFKNQDFKVIVRNLVRNVGDVRVVSFIKDDIAINLAKTTYWNMINSEDIIKSKFRDLSKIVQHRAKNILIPVLEDWITKPEYNNSHAECLQILNGLKKIKNDYL